MLYSNQFHTIITHNDTNLVDVALYEIDESNEDLAEEY